MSLSALEYAQQAKELCVLPDVYLRLKEVMDDPQSTLADIANIVCLDPALSLTLLKIANSALFNFPREIDSISRAIMVLGIEEIRNLVNTYGVTTTFSHTNIIDIDIDRFWEVSVDCALICKFLAPKVGLNNDGVFLSGLLHNIGELAIAQSESKKVIYCQGYSKDETPWQRQQDVFGFTYADCGAALLKLWQLPESLIIPIREYHHAYGHETNKKAKLLYVASRLALLNSHPGMYSKHTFLGQHLMKDLGLTFEDIDDAVNFCNLEGLSILTALKLKT
ncbi:MAG: HD-like signal output (HDOD) protein [Alteromonadaceae bacterium]|jgi:HD-like signal output (HDOD) protein